MSEDNKIRIDVEANDEASAQIAQASENIAASLKTVADIESEFAESVNETIAPLTAEEQAKLASAAASLQLKDAQEQVSVKQQELNEAIRTYGADSEEAAVKLRELDSAQQAASEAAVGMSENTARASVSLKDLTVSIAGVATAGFNLYNAYDNIEDANVQLSRAQYQVNMSTNAVTNAQNRLNATIEKFGPHSKEAAAAQESLNLAMERNAVDVERLDMVSGNYNETIVRSALSVIPSLITLTASLSQIKGMLTASTVAGTAAESASSVAKTVAVAPTLTLTGAVAALNAVLMANPIILVVAAIAALVAGLIYAYNACKPFKDAVDGLASAIMSALKPALDVVGGALMWLWDNILKPIAEFLGGVFIAQIKLVADALGWLGSVIGSAVNWLGDQWAKLTGTYAQRVQEGMDKALEAVEQGLAEQVEAVNKKYDEMTAIVESAYSEQTDAAIKSWEQRLNQEVVGWDKVLKTANDQADKLLDERKAKLREETGAIEDSYDEQLDSMKSAYQDQLDEINSFYDKVIDTTESKLKGVRSAREDDLNQLEYTYLLQKQQIEDAVANNALASAAGQAQLEALEKSYNDRRKTISEDYRVQELQAEMEHKANSLTAEAERQTKLEQARRDEAAMEAYLIAEKTKLISAAEKQATDEIAKLQEERNILIGQIQADRDRIESEHSSQLQDIYRQRENELTQITENAARARERIISESNSRIEAENRRLGVPAGNQTSTTTAPAFMRNPQTGQIMRIPGMAGGALVEGPTLALIGEGSEKEWVLPDSKLQAAVNGGARTQHNTLYITVNIGNITKDVQLEDVEESVVNGVIEAAGRMS